MKKVKSIVLALASLGIIIVASSYFSISSEANKNECSSEVQMEPKQTINLFVSHGHCSTPFSGQIEDLNLVIPKREDQGNPLENMKISFDVDPNSFNVCAGDDLTKRIKTPGLFISENNERITFRTTNVYTMGLDWYQINGLLSIKGVQREVKLFATGIRDPKESMSTLLVLEGKMNLQDWGIDYDKIVTGKSDPVPTKWMYINMKIELC